MEAAIPHGNGDDVVGDPLHGVVDRHAGGDRSTWGVDVQVDVSVRVLGIEQEHLRAQGVGILVLDLRAKEDDPVAQQGLVDVVRHADSSRRGVSHPGHVRRSGCILLVHVYETTASDQHIR